MSWTELAPIIEAALKATGYVNSVYEGDVYDMWNNTDVPYVSACYDEVGMPDSGSESIDRYDVLVYVADRLEDDGSNTRHARDFSRAVLKVALAQLRRSEAVLSVGAEPLQPFVQKFADNLAGYYTTLSIMVRNDIENC